MAPRRLGTAIGIAALAAALLVWRCRDADTHDDGSSTTTTTQHVSTSVRARTDPRTLDRASLAGTVTDGATQPLAAARVCATATSDALPTSLVDEPHCTVTDAAGRYTIAPLFAADYTVAAMAKPYRPEQLELHLAAGEHRVHADIALDRPGVEITGTVEDVSGGPIAHAYRLDQSGASIESGFASRVEAAGEALERAIRGAVELRQHRRPAAC